MKASTLEREITWSEPCPICGETRKHGHRPEEWWAWEEGR